MIRVCPLSELPRREAMRVDVEPPIAVFHTEDGEIVAVDDTCTHQDASRSEGWWTGAMERPANAVAALLRGDSAEVGEGDNRGVAVPYFWSDQCDRQLNAPVAV